MVFKVVVIGVSYSKKLRMAAPSAHFFHTIGKVPCDLEVVKP
jgi:hypothetical protein